VTVIMGSLLRDRIADKSCVLYESSSYMCSSCSHYFSQVLSAFPYTQLDVQPRMIIRTEAGSESIQLRYNRKGSNFDGLGDELENKR
jgi:hypothetical protein